MAKKSSNNNFKKARASEKDEFLVLGFDCDCHTFQSSFPDIFR